MTRLSRIESLMPSVNRHALAIATPAAASVWQYGPAMFRKAGSDVAALALLQIACFLILAHVEPRFVLIHFYQLIPYVALFLLIIYGQRRGAYMIGPLVSIGWLSIAYWAGLLSWAVEQLRAMEAFSTATLVALLAFITAVVAVIMTLRCRLCWVREYAGQAQSYRIFFLCAGLVATYYWILIRWFWNVVLGVHSAIPL